MNKWTAGCPTNGRERGTFFTLARPVPGQQ